MSVYVMTHKRYEIFNDPVYKPLLVGAALHNPEGTSDYLHDDEGDNISRKNLNFCELTGLYWVWKHSSDEVVGLVHYRRYFGKGKKILTGEQISALLQTVPLVLPKKRHYYIETVSQQYEHAHHKEDLECTKAVISQMCPDYLSSYERVMARRSLHILNMFIAKREVMDAYCAWLFPILFEVERSLDISSYSKNDSRVFGFLSERLFNVWVEKNEIPYKEIGVVNLEPQHWGKKIFNFLMRKAGRKR